MATKPEKMSGLVRQRQLRESKNLFSRLPAVYAASRKAGSISASSICWYIDRRVANTLGSDRSRALSQLENWRRFSALTTPWYPVLCRQCGIRV
jgi:hypothetical protein